MPIKISIIVPIYNVAPYLSQCIESLCNQTLKEIEIIAVNDASTDNSLKILESYSHKDQRLKIINKTENEGTASARNSGLSMAQGEYVSFIDGDDFVDANFYERLYNLAINDDADIAKGVTKSLHTDGSIQIAQDNTAITQFGKFAFMGHLLSAIYRRQFLSQHDIKFHIDFFCFQIQAVYYANKIICCNDVYYNYVRHADSCDSEVFTLEKWQRLNLGHANYIYHWIQTHPYTEEIKKVYLERVKGLYFYGFNKLKKSDIPTACKILSQTLAEEYDCGFDTHNLKKLQRKLYRKNRKTGKLDFYLNLIKGQI